jgi:hypothetical protein
MNPISASFSMKALGWCSGYFAGILCCEVPKQTHSVRDGFSTLISTSASNAPGSLNQNRDSLRTLKNSGRSSSLRRATVTKENLLVIHEPLFNNWPEHRFSICSRHEPEIQSNPMLGNPLVPSLGIRSVG